MLVLGLWKHPHQGGEDSVWIHTPSGEKIRIILTDVRVRGQLVKLGFEAPLNVGIYRASLCDDDGNLKEIR